MKSVLLPKEIINGQLFVVLDEVAYSSHGWFGCQLQSIEKCKPDAFTNRVVSRDSKSFNLELVRCERVGLLKYDCYWRLVQRENWTEYTEKIKEMLNILFKNV